MPEVFIANREIVGAPTKVFADQDGTFRIYDADDEELRRSLGSADTLDGAVTKARTTLSKRRVEVNVEFVTVGGKRGVATKRHAKNGTVMARIGGGVSEQLDSGTKVFKPGTPAEVITEYLKGQEEHRRRYEKLRQTESDHVVKLHTLVDAAVKEAVESAELVPTG